MMSVQTQKRTPNREEQIASVLLMAVLSYVLIRACIEIYTVSWGTGVWLGEFSLMWGVVFFLFVVFCIMSETVAIFVIWKQEVFKVWKKRIIALRQKMGNIRWLVVVFLLVFPVWILQLTPWGIVFRELYFRLMLWGYIVLALGVFIEGSEKFLSWFSLLTALLLTSTVFSVAFAFINVSNYPFSIGWSEGNRMWDYSLFFGRRLYDFPVDNTIYSPTSEGRQLVGGLPFLLPNITIVVERIWVALTTIIPYLLVGFAAFHSEIRNKKNWFLLALFTFIFLKQGPIHPPLVLSAFMVAMLWRKPLWLAVPLIFITAYLTEVSRYTWLFAPGIWIVMLEFSGAFLKDGRLQKGTWFRSAALGVSGVVGGYWGSSLINWFKSLFISGETVSLTGGGAISISSVASDAATHPLLWYRLLPSATSGYGILLSVLLAVTPTITLLIYLSASKKWKLNNWQKAALILPLLAFLIVGLIISTKAGGGGDLHNLDMFFIGILFSAVIAWENGGRQWLSQIEMSPLWVKGTLALLLIIPGIQPLSGLRSFHFAEDIPWLMVLTDVSDGRLLEMLPPDDEVNDILGIIRKEIDAARPNGEILFMDQRQLLTFGYVEDVALVPEYEKKVLMNQAMADDEVYFEKLYADLAAQRFSLIINEPLRAPAKDSSFEFGEENNAWVKWMVYPVLCYYEPVETFRSVQVELLVPRQGDFDCSSELPLELQK